MKLTFTLWCGDYGITRMAVEHAPTGGISIGGKKFDGGEFIPGDVLAKATKEEKAKLEGGAGGAEESSGQEDSDTNQSRLESNAVEDYTQDKFQEINGQLRGNRKQTRDGQTISSRVDRFLENGTKRPGVTVRSFNIPKGSEGDFASMLETGAVFSDKAFTSTRSRPSLVDRAAFRNKTAPSNRVVMRIEGRSGVDISSLSSNPEEGEVLYPRNTQFKVTKQLTLTNGAILLEAIEVIEKT